MLLADEPVAALDPLHQLRAMALLRAAARKGAGVVAVLHDLTLATRFCDRLIVLAEGRVVADGPPSALTDAVLAEAYGVTAVRGERDGERFVVPWRAAGPRPSGLTARLQSGSRIAMERPCPDSSSSPTTMRCFAPVCGCC